MPKGIYPSIETRLKQSESAKNRKNNFKSIYRKINIPPNPVMWFLWNDDCWNWGGCCTQNGYGQVRIYKKSYLIHRFIYKEIYDIIPSGKCILHHCDNRKCCNPNHLYAGTAQDNTNDMISKGRQYHTIGEENGAAKLTNEQVKQIKILYPAKKYRQTELAQMFNVSPSIIFSIIHGKSWRKII